MDNCNDGNDTQEVCTLSDTDTFSLSFLPIKGSLKIYLFHDDSETSCYDIIIDDCKGNLLKVPQNGHYVITKNNDSAKCVEVYDADNKVITESCVVGKIYYTSGLIGFDKPVSGRMNVSYDTQLPSDKTRPQDMLVLSDKNKKEYCDYINKTLNDIFDKLCLVDDDLTKVGKSVDMLCYWGTKNTGSEDAHQSQTLKITQKEHNINKFSNDASLNIFYAKDFVDRCREEFYEIQSMFLPNDAEDTSADE